MSPPHRVVDSVVVVVDVDVVVVVVVVVAGVVQGAASSPSPAK